MSVDKIKEYCRRLGSHSEDRTVLKDTLYKLNKMEVTLDILQKTEIDKIVNKIKNRGGKTGDMAADLIKKWRHVVDREAEQEKVEDNNNNNHGSHGHHGSSKTEAIRDSHQSHESSKSTDVKQTRTPSFKDASEASSQKTVFNKKRKTPDDDGMDANFGSFEECLGSVDPKNLKKKKKFRSSSSPKMTITSCTLSGSSSEPKGPRLPDLTDRKPAESASPVLDVKPLARVEPEPQSLPQPQRPSQLQRQLLAQAAPQAPAKRPVFLDEAAQFTSSRKDRTAIYSGRRNATLTSAPSLVDACTRMLMGNIDYLKETGGVPYTVLKPVLERCTWQQLHQLECHNPYLTEESDPLWEVHCRKDFRNKTPQRGEESWKELYLRCRDEREQKLKSLTASIGQSMREKQAPVRTTKLAYVDSIAKAPLNVQRAQLKNGTFNGNKAQPSQARRIASQAATSAATDAVRPPPAAAASRRPKLAPLMAKTLSFIKMRKSIGYGFASR